MIVIKTRKYKGAYILILNEWQSFLAIIFYKGQFYKASLEAELILKNGKIRDYTNNEFITAADTMLKEAKRVVDAIKIKRSLITKTKILLKWLINQITNRHIEAKNLMIL